MLSEDSTIQEIREFFSRDLFAMRCGCEIVDAGRGFATCAMDLVPEHRNAQGNVMGGAIFTLADFAVGVAANIGEAPTAGITNTIDYLSFPRGARLTATARVEKSGNKVAFYAVDVTDELGTDVARMSCVAYRKG